MVSTSLNANSLGRFEIHHWLSDANKDNKIDAGDVAHIRIVGGTSVDIHNFSMTPNLPAGATWSAASDVSAWVANHFTSTGQAYASVYAGGSTLSAGQAFGYQYDGTITTSMDQLIASANVTGSLAMGQGKREY